MTPLRVLIADDERPARARLEDLLRPRVDVSLLRACSHGAEAAEAIRQQRPDLVFLDVQMPEVSGLDVVRQLGEDMPVTVFVTAYDRYALDAFDARAVDYLLKPYSDERFHAALDRAVQFVHGGGTQALLARLSALVESVPPPAPPGRASAEPGSTEAGTRLDRFVVKATGRAYLVDAREVSWIHGAGNYVVLHAAGQRHLYRASMTQLAERLDPRWFVRVHKSSIVNLEFVRELLPDSHGEFTLVLRDGAQVRLSRTYRGVVEARLGQGL